MNPSLYGFPYSVDSTPDPRAQNFQNGYACVKVTPPKYPKCCQGNPVETIGGAKTQRDTDFVAPNGKLALIRHYRSDNLDGPAFLGNGWSVEGLHRLDLRMFTDGSVTLNLGSGEYKFFSSADGVTWQTDRHELDHLVALSPSGGVPSGWIYYSEDQQSLNQFDSLGKLTKTTFVDGSELSFTYQANGTIQTISDQTGRTISFAYSGEGLVGSVQTPDGTITYEYSAPIDFTTTAADRNLVAVSYPGSTSVHYLYGESSNISGNDPWLVSGRHFLTGRIDEKGVRVGTYKYLFEYDDYTKTTSARAISTEGAGGVNRFSFARQLLSGITDITNPAGTTSRSLSRLVADPVYFQGLIGETDLTQPAGSGYASSTRATAYDVESGNVESRDDFAGVRTCYSYDPARNIEVARVVGLANTQVCNEVTSSGAALPAGSSKSSTQWHPDWQLKTRFAEPGKITSTVYNGQPDPFAGGAAAACAPAGAVLPDGKPIAVVCRRVEQATTDADGHLGFAALLDATVAARATTYTYDAAGRVLTRTDPRNFVTTYTYFADSTADHRPGDLASIRNAANHVTSYTRYDAAGRLLERVESNAVVSSYTFDPRGRLASASTGGETTAYGYDLAGNNTLVTLADGTTISSEFDAAHRLVRVTDSAGNTVTYTLDNTGNRTAEVWKDSGGNLARNISRVYDALSRLQSVTGAQQ